MIIATSIIAGVLFAAPAEGVPFCLKDRSLVDLFEPCEYRYPGGQYQQELFRYRLFVPRNRRSTEQYPLLVWLHGYGENGSDNQLSLRHLDLVLDDPSHVEKYRFFILVVQCPAANPVWFRASHPAYSPANSPDDMLSVTFAILQKTLREQPVDPDRVYLAGVSGGGTACWEMAARYPEVFAAVTPMASAGGSESQAAQLVHLPIWAFHNLHDSSTPPRSAEQIVAGVNQAGGNAYLTLFPAKEHDCWRRAFRHCGAMAWLLEQRRGAWICWTPPGCRPWRWWHVGVVPAVFLGFAGAAWCSERKRRQRTRSQTLGHAESHTAGDGES